jgi:GDPmannose 4,6-dehydratase
MGALRAALITGITGQDGSYMAELLLGKGYAVYGLMRRSSKDTRGNVRHLADHPRFVLRYGDVLDAGSLVETLRVIDAVGHADPLEVYNFAAQSHVHVSFDMPVYTAQTDGIGALNVLEALRQRGRPARLCQASTSEMFGSSPPPQTESTPFHPRSPYGVSKVFAYWAVRNYREAHGLHACNAISFNHESERRGASFVTRKITQGVARLAAGRDPRPILLGNLDAKRDWQHAEDVVRAMWLMVQLPEPGDYVVATGTQRSVREFVEIAFAASGMRVEWRGAGLEERGVVGDRTVVAIDPALFRPAEVDSLQGDSTKLRRATGWAPEVSFAQLVERMVRHDAAALARADAADATATGGTRR